MNNDAHPSTGQPRRRTLTTAVFALGLAVTAAASAGCTVSVHRSAAPEVSDAYSAEVKALSSDEREAFDLAAHMLSGAKPPLSNDEQTCMSLSLVETIGASRTSDIAHSVSMLTEGQVMSYVESMYACTEPVARFVTLLDEHLSLLPATIDCLNANVDPDGLFQTWVKVLTKDDVTFDGPVAKQMRSCMTDAEWTAMIGPAA